MLTPEPKGTGNQFRMTWPGQPPAASRPRSRPSGVPPGPPVSHHLSDCSAFQLQLRATGGPRAGRQTLQESPSRGFWGPPGVAGRACAAGASQGLAPAETGLVTHPALPPLRARRWPLRAPKPSRPQDFPVKFQNSARLTARAGTAGPKACCGHTASLWPRGGGHRAEGSYWVWGARSEHGRTWLRGWPR